MVFGICATASLPARMGRAGACDVPRLCGSRLTTTVQFDIVLTGLNAPSRILHNPCDVVANWLKVTGGRGARVRVGISGVTHPQRWVTLVLRRPLHFGLEATTAGRGFRRMDGTCRNQVAADDHAKVAARIRRQAHPRACPVRRGCVRGGSGSLTRGGAAMREAMQRPNDLSPNSERLNGGSPHAHEPGAGASLRGKDGDAIPEFDRFLKAYPQPGPVHYGWGPRLAGPACDAVGLLEQARGTERAGAGGIGDAYWGASAGRSEDPSGGCWNVAWRLVAGGCARFLAGARIPGCPVSVRGCGAAVCRRPRIPVRVRDGWRASTEPNPGYRTWRRLSVRLGPDAARGHWAGSSNCIAQPSIPHLKAAAPTDPALPCR